MKKEEKKAAAAPAPVKKEEKKAAAAPAPVKKEEKKAAAAPAKKEVKKAAAAPAPVKFELTAARKRELINIGSDITKNAPFSNSGRLVAVPNPSGDCTAVALIGLSDGRSLGFLFAEAPIMLKKYIDKEVSVKGFAYRVKGGAILSLLLLRSLKSGNDLYDRPVTCCFFDCGLFQSLRS